MKTAQLSLSKNLLTVTVGASSILIRLVLMFFASVSFLIPIAVVAFTVTNHSDFNFIFVIITIICWLSAFYLLRIILWNTYGKEQLLFMHGKVVYEADYKFFKDAKMEIIGTIAVEIVVNKYSKKDENTLLLKSDDEQIETVISLPFDTWQLVLDDINLMLGNVDSDFEIEDVVEIEL